MTQSIKKNIIITFLSQVIILFIGIGTSIILARALGPEGRGMYALIALIPAIMLKLGNMGIESANIYFTANKKYKTEDIVANSFFCSILFGVILIFLFYSISYLSIFQKFILKNKLNLSYIYLLVFALPVSLTSLFIKNILLGNHNIKLYNVLGFIDSLIQMITFFVFLVLFKKGVGGAVLASLVDIFFILAMSIFFIKKFVRLKIAFNRILFLDLIRYGYKSYLGNLAQFLNYRLDMLLVGFFLGAVQVGYYAIAVTIVERLWLLPHSIATVLFPKVSAGKEQESNVITPRIARNTFFIITICSLFLVFVTKPIIKLFFGASFLPSYHPLLVLLPGIITLSISKVLCSDMLGRGKPQFGAYSSFLSLFINIPLNLWLIPKWGIAGAAFASSIAYVLATSIVVYYFVKLTRNFLADIFIMKKQDFLDYLNILKFKIGERKG